MNHNLLHFILLFSSFGLAPLLSAADPFPPEGTAPIAPDNAAGPFEIAWIAPRVRARNFSGDLRFSEDGKRLLVALEGQAQVWDTATWKPVGPRIEYGDWIRNVGMDSTGKRLLVKRDLLTEKPVPGGTRLSYDDVEWRLWDAESGRAISAPTPLNVQAMTPDNKRVLAAGMTVLSPDGRLVAATPEGKVVHLLDMENDKKEQILKFENWIERMWFLPDSSSLVVTDSEGVAHTLDLKTGKLRSSESNGFDRVVAFGEGRALVDWFFGFTVRELRTGKALLSCDDYAKYDVGDMLMSRDGRRVAVEIALREIEVWDVDSQKRLTVLESNGPRAMDPKGTVIISDSWKVLPNREVERAPAMWDTQTGKKVREFEGFIGDITFSPDGNLLVMQQGRVIRAIRADPTKKGAERWKVEKGTDEKK